MTEANLQLLKTAVPYIRAFKGKTFVLKLGGEICIPGKQLTNLVEQFALLYQLGIKLIVVHGGGPQASELAEKLNVKTQFINGRRITSPEMLEVAKLSFAGQVNTDIVAEFYQQQVPAIGMSGIDGGLITAARREVKQVENLETGKTQEVDFGLVGEIEAIHPEVLYHLLDGKMVPVVCSLVAQQDGTIMNINADTLASAIAEAVNAEKYCLLSSVDGVLADLEKPETLISELTVKEAESLIADGVIQGGMHPKVTNCIDVLKRGIPRAHITSGLAPDAFLREIFTNEGCGTMLIPDRD